MIIWGSGGNTIDLGEVESKTCPICVQPRKYKLILQYRYGHLYYIFGALTEKKYICACEVCGRGALLMPKEVESRLGKNPIPFTHRMGWSILVGLIGVFVLIALFSH